MLNRRLLRIKVFQTLYAYYQTEDNNLLSAEKNLFNSIYKMHELFVSNLALILKLSDLSDERLEVNKQKYIKSEQDSDLLRKLSENLVIQNLKNNSHLGRLISNYNINWSEEEDLLKKIIRLIENSDLYKEYRANDDFTLESDTEFLKKLYNVFIYNDDDVVLLLEAKNLHWVQDQYYIGVQVGSFLKKHAPSLKVNDLIPEIFKKADFDDEQSDESFVKSLFYLTIEMSSQTETDIIKFIDNWEPERIALSDMIIMKMACTEILKFEQIPVKSTLNEYIELAKLYSTPKSKVFINGILDKVFSYYQREDKYEKIGRGLKENS